MIYRPKASGITLANETWIVDRKGRVAVDLSQPRYTLAFADFADDATDDRTLIKRFGLLNSGTQQTETDYAAQRTQLRTVSRNLTQAGFFDALVPITQGDTTAAQHTLADLLTDAMGHMEVVIDPETFTATHQPVTLLDHMLIKAQQFAQLAVNGSVTTRTCDHCGRAFVPANQRQHFCSASCRTMHNRGTSS